MRLPGSFGFSQWKDMPPLERWREAELMTYTKRQNDFYYITLTGSQKTGWLADERVKKRFLDELVKARDGGAFRVYAFCILDEEAHFLLSIPCGRKIAPVLTKISGKLMKSYLSQYPQGREQAKVAARRLFPGSRTTVLEYCCRIHLMARGYAKKLQDYWWSSYVEYLHRNIIGLTETEVILEALDAEPRRALQKFVRYHEKYIPATIHAAEKKS